MSPADHPSAWPPQAGDPATVDAQKLTGTLRPGARDATFSYAVLDEVGSEPGGDRRSFARQRTRLRSGKLIDVAGNFITECLVHNRSASGCRLRLPTGTPLPRGLDFYEDQSGRLFHAVLVWQRDREVGLRLVPCPPNRLSRLTAERMRAKYYGLQR